MVAKQMMYHTPEEMANVLVTKFAEEMDWDDPKQMLEEAESCALAHIKLLIEYMNIDEVDQPKSLYDYMIDVQMILEKKKINRR